MDDGPRLPEGVTLKRVPGMRIDFAEYQALARAALVRARQKGATPDLTEAGVEELYRRTMELAEHNRAYSAWLASRTQATQAEIDKRAKFGLVVVVLVALVLAGVLQHFGIRLHRW